MDAMVNLDWCRKQSKGIKLIEPNENLCQEYLTTSEETLKEIQKTTSKIWLATELYYCEYFAIYALLMKIGIKCEIHDCTIEISKMLEAKKIIPAGYSEILENHKQLRIDNQYYLKNRDVEFNRDDLIQFVLKIKDVCTKLTIDDIEKIRNSFG